MKLSLDDCLVDLDTRTVTRGDQTKRLTGTEASLLRYLTSRPHEVISREELYREVWDHQVELLTRTLDLAVFRLRKKIEKDPSSPDHVMTVYGRGYSFVPRGEDTQRSQAPAHSPASATNLGREENHFFGREDEHRALTYLMQTRSGFITVLGPPGTGKTRLTKHWAAEHLSSGAVTSAWFCDLTEARSEEGVIQAVASDIGVSLTTTEDGLAALAELVGKAIKDLGVSLIVIDNAEQVVQWVGPLVERWWKHATEASFVITSQVPTGVAMEQRLPLDPLPMPSAEDAGTPCPAVQLFVDRAQSVNPAFERTVDNQAGIANIVRQLDGLPLAIELAAARMHLMTPYTLQVRLADRFRLLKRPKQAGPARHQTLQAALDWSWDLLEPWEQAALAQCSVFHGGFDWEAVEAVVDLSAWPKAPWSVDVVAELIERSLVMAQDDTVGLSRLSLLSSVAEYARNKLSECAQHSVQAAGIRHCRHYAQFGSQDYISSLSKTGSVARLWRLHGEQENLIAGMDTALASDEADTAAQCAIGAVTVLTEHGPFTQALTILKRLSGCAISPATQGQLFKYSGWVMKLSGHTSEAEAAYKKALVNAQQLGNTELQSTILAWLGTLAREQGHTAQAEKHLDNALKIAQANGHTMPYQAALAYMAILKEKQGQLKEALSYYQQAIDLARKHGNRAAEGTSTGNMANLYKEQGDFSIALKHYKDALEIVRQVGNRRSEATILANTATIHQDMGESAKALGYYTQALTVIRQTGELRVEGITLGNIGNLLYAEGNFSSASDHLQQAISICDTVAPSAAGQFRANLAIVRSEQGDFDEARTLLNGARQQAASASRITKGTIHCASAQVEYLAGDTTAAAASLSHAESIAEDVQVKPDSELGRAIAEARALLDS
jgi:predicted ATPase/DNA-binding winged helix-turn-helix (wHTH) protein/Tfp pilus assembly protein PilF